MIDARLWKVDQGGWRCSNSQCKHSPEYHYNLIGNVWDLKLGTTCVIILPAFSGEEIYCRDCIDQVYHRLKPVLDTKLWTFM
jgi:hypothetical protein